MERMKLTRLEKMVLLRLDRFGADSLLETDRNAVLLALHGLSRKGLVCCAFTEGGGIEDVRMTSFGRCCVAENARQCGPSGWRFVAVIALAVAGAVALAVLKAWS